MKVGGLGYRRGEDSRVNQDESDKIRRVLEPDLSGLVFTNLPQIVALADIVVIDANLIRLYHCPTGARGHVLTEARVGVTTTAAGASVQTGIYAIEYSPTLALKLVAGSVATFSAASTGLQTFPLPNKVTLQPNTDYWVAVESTSALVGLSGQDPNGYYGNQAVYFAYNSFGLPMKLPFDQATPSSTEIVLGVWYLSSKGALVL